MHYLRYSNYKLGKKLIIPLGILCSIGMVGVFSRPASAATPSASITVGDVNGRMILQPMDGRSAGDFYVPITIKVSNAKDYTVSFQVNNNGKLIDSTTSEYIPSVATPTAKEDLDNQWGMHYNFGNTINDDKTKNYSAPPTTEEVILPDSTMSVTSRPNGTTETKYLTLGYATKLREDFPAGSYAGQVTVNVVASPLETIHSLVYMQDMTHDICSYTNTPSNTATLYDDTGEHTDDASYIPRTMLADMRDQHWYIVSKLADGNCWMTENLALSSGTTEATRRTITSADSNVTSDYKLPISSTSGFSDNGAQNMYNGTETSTVTSDISTHYNTTTHTGGYYSWPTATAGEGKNGAIAAGNNATQDICPKGWQLPTGQATTGDFTKLYNKYTNKTNFDQVWHIVNNNSYVGYYVNSALANSAASTDWWSRTSSSDTNAYRLDELTSGNINPSTNRNRLYGFSIRCVAK